MEDKKEIRKVTIQLDVENNHNMGIGNSLLDWKDAEDSTCCMTCDECMKFEEEMKKQDEEDKKVLKKIYARDINNLLLSLIKKGTSKELLKKASDRTLNFKARKYISLAYDSNMPEKYILKMLNLDTFSDMRAYMEGWLLYKNEELLDVLATLDDYEAMYVYMDAYGRKMKPENLKQLASLESTISMCDYFKAYFMGMPQKHLDVMADPMLGHRRYMEAYFIGMPEEKLEVLKNLFDDKFFFYYDAYVKNMDDKNIERGLNCANPGLFMDAFDLQMSDNDLERLAQLSSDDMELYINARMNNFDEDAINKLYEIMMNETEKTTYITAYKFYEDYCYNRSNFDSIKKELLENYDEYDEEFINQIFKTEENSL